MVYVADGNRGQALPYNRVRQIVKSASTVSRRHRWKPRAGHATPGTAGEGTCRRKQCLTRRSDHQACIPALAGSAIMSASTSRPTWRRCFSARTARHDRRLGWIARIPALTSTRVAATPIVPGSSPGPPSVRCRTGLGYRNRVRHAGGTTCSRALLSSSCSPSGVSPHTFEAVLTSRPLVILRRHSAPAVIFSVSIDARLFVLARQSFPFEVCVLLDMGSSEARIPATHPSRRWLSYK
jgi:hypothetical protein